MKTGSVIVAALLLSVVGVSSAFAAGGEAREFNLDFQLSSLNPGRTVLGDVWTVETLTNHIVLVEIWGINCGPCLASIPQMTKLQKEYGDKGLVVIGLQCQDFGDDAVKATASQKGAEYTVTNGGTIKGYQGGGIPHCYLFDSTGRCVFRGSPTQVEGALMMEKLKEAVANSPLAALGDRELKKLNSLAQAMKAGMLPAQVLTKAKTLALDPDPETAEEAKFLVEALNKWGGMLADAAMKNKDKNPIKCLEDLTDISRKFSGTDIATLAKESLDKLRNDSKFQADLKAYQVYLKIRELDDQVVPVKRKDGIDTSSQQFIKKNFTAIKNILTGARMMEKRFPDSPATAHAKEIAAKYENLGK